MNVFLLINTPNQKDTCFTTVERELEEKQEDSSRN